MKITPRFFAAFVAAFTLLVSVRAAELDGKWKAEFETQIGTQKYVFEFKTDGEKLTGKAIGERDGTKDEVPITEGKIAKDEISFVEVLNFQGQEIRIAYNGKFAGGDEIKFTRHVADVATEELVATRVKE